ncbi:YggT family protein [Desulfococcaceae bacterium OttesenSCG-928-F15]|nr:YggT family protein [Desulfococcaceae bacterium OttesenSCG-928-F15]
MIILGNFFVGLAKVVNMILILYLWIILARALSSWFRPNPYHPLMRLLYQLTDPVLSRIRRIVPLQFGGLDFSPIIVLLAIMFLQEFLVKSLFQLGVMLASS